MTKLRVMSGSDVVKIFEGLGFSVAKQRGSHIKLKRINDSGIRQILIIPNHKEIDRGTLKGILNQASRYFPEAELRKHFYS